MYSQSSGCLHTPCDVQPATRPSSQSHNLCLSQALQEELAWARLTGKPRPTGFPPNTSCSRAALALDALAASTQQAFDTSGPVRKKKHAAAAAAPNAAAHMAAASAAFAAGRRADLLTHRERNSMLRQLHRDNAWLLGCLTDSNAALEQLHDRLTAEQKVGSCYILTSASGDRDSQLKA